MSLVFITHHMDLVLDSGHACGVWMFTAHAIRGAFDFAVGGRAAALPHALHGVALFSDFGE